MEPQLFTDVFEKIPFSDDILTVFSDTTVTSLKIQKQQRKIAIDMVGDAFISMEHRALFQMELKKELPDLKEVSLHCKLSPTAMPKEDIFEKYWTAIASIIKEDSRVCKEIIKAATWKYKDNAILIFVQHHMAYFMTKKKYNRLIEQFLLEETGIIFEVLFKDVQLKEEEIVILMKEKQAKVDVQIEEAIQINMQLNAESSEKKEQSNASQKTKSNATEQEIEQEIEQDKIDLINEGILYGKKYNKNQPPVKISNSKTVDAFVTIKGYIFNVNAREIRGERYIVSFDIYDGDDSTTVKFFTKKTLYAHIKKQLKEGEYLLVNGKVEYDSYAKGIAIMARGVNVLQKPEDTRVDNAEEKRVELHLHTQMSSMDGITSIKKYVERAKKYGHKTLAITDHGVVQAFPDGMHAIEKSDMKIIYGVEGYLINDLGTVVSMAHGQNLNDTFIVFDVETTGLSKDVEMLIEIGAVKVKNGEIIDRFSTFVNPEKPIPENIVALTNITDDMVADAPKTKEAITNFMEFVGDSVLVAHNANFDMGFLRVLGKRFCDLDVVNTVLDTLELSRCLLPEVSKHNLKVLCDHLGISLEGHHRAVHDAEATAKMFLRFTEMLLEKDVYTLDEVNIFADRTINHKKLRNHHIIILAKNKTGLRNLYELISLSHLNYFYRRPRIPKSKLIKHRDGLIIGSACEAGELYRSILDSAPEDVVKEIVNFYDYLEIQPLGNNQFMIDSVKIPSIRSEDDLIGINEKIIELGEQYNKPVVATGDVHFLNPEDKVFRKIVMAAEGFSDVENQPPLYYRTTEEMLQEFQYLGEKKAKEVVVTNTNLIADMVENILPIPAETFPPKIEGADEELRRICMEKAESLYGTPLPDLVGNRLQVELDSIINNGYAVLYIIAQKLVWKSVEDGYLVGSRGSVGSSFAANMAGITEVNSLPPHYLCPNCKYSDFSSELVHSYAMQEACGCDMPDANCPTCGTKLLKEGHDIPFETFLGFEGDKEPDIDLNFSGEYQQKAHAYTEELFGEGHVFKAGTIGTLAEKTAYGFVKKYLDAREMTVHNAEVQRLLMGCTGIKRTTGQHPGGLMVVPQGHDIHEFCPVQRPANDMKSTVTTTHFDYHSISGRLLKLDLLGHDDPTVIRMLHDLTGINPQDVPLGDPDTMSLFLSPKALGVTEEEIECQTGTLGVPEFGTKFVRGMLEETKPTSFSDLLRISGLSHGTDVWVGNAQMFIEQGIIELKDTISTRDGIMIYLINKGMDKKQSFKIMENVRKGKGLTPDEEEIMKNSGVPDWYIKSCKTIKYMFPKAHAAAYVMMAFRIAYFKVNYPIEYYAAYFTVRASDDFDYASMCLGLDHTNAVIKELQAKGNEMTTKEKSKITVLELAREFYVRGFHFLPIHLYESDGSKFLLRENALLPPLNSLQGIGINAVHSLMEAREDGEFKTIEDLKARTTLGKVNIELLRENGVLEGIPETNQMTLF